MKQTFYVMFGQKYPWRDGWVEISAIDRNEAYEIVNDVFGEHYAFLYSEEQFNRSFFPDGKLGKTLV